MSIQDILFMLKILTKYSKKRKDFLARKGSSDRFICLRRLPNAYSESLNFHNLLKKKDLINSYNFYIFMLK